MTTRRERALLFSAARDHFLNKGVIVDAGIFLGASTAAFAQGLRENPNCANGCANRIVSYDIARWVKSMDRYLETLTDLPGVEVPELQPGQSFEPLLRQLLSTYQPMIDLKIGDLLKMAPSFAQPVEIAFFDCLKTYERDFAAFRSFTPHYIEGHTVIFQQDYFYESAAYNKVRCEYYIDHYEYLGQVDDTAVFLYLKKIDIPADEADPVKNLPAGEKVRLIDLAADRAQSQKKRLLVRLSALELLIDEGQHELAQSRAAILNEEIMKADLDQITRRPGLVLEAQKKRLSSIE
ncbi:class I SAM-dependent methyltransferase [Roseibium sp.]|uniref:class I SAM-dependent methyltransferase n=1 Tax=Roseibium sp. TaxID=1936156 RepID=UPI003D0BB432